MATMVDSEIAQEVKHKTINGKHVILEYHEFLSTEGKTIVRYSVLINGEAYPMELEIPKEILQTIQKRYDKEIYHIIHDSILDWIKDGMSTLSTKVNEAKVPGPLTYY